MLRGLLSILILGGSSYAVEARCVDPATLTQSTVSIMRYFQDEDKAPGVIGIRGTAWFLSPTSMVTVEHVAASMHLSDQSWKEVVIEQGEHVRSIPARIQQVTGSSSTERIAVIELQTAFAGAQSLDLRMEPLVSEEPVVSLGYPGGHLRVAAGRFVQYGDGARLEGTALFEIYDRDDRLALDHGASGAPVLDCEGHVVAVVSNLLVTTLQFFSRQIRVPTAWGIPTWSACLFPC